MNTSSAFLYDGNKRLAGHLSVSEEGLWFYFSDFSKSHLNLHIEIRDIDRVEVFKIYDLTANGLKIISYNGREDLFVLGKPEKMKVDIELFKNKLV